MIKIKRTRRELLQHLVFECDNLTQQELEKAADYCIEDAFLDGIKNSIGGGAFLMMMVFK